MLTNNFDLIITGYNNGHWLAPYLKGNVWHWIHGDLLEFRKFNNPLKQIKEHIRFFKNKRKFAKLFKNRNLITVNRDLESKAQTYAQPKSTVTIANGVQVSDDLIAQAPYTEKKWDVIFVGRLVPIKQVDHAIKAFSMSNLTGKMAIVGDGTERQTLETLTKVLRIEDRIDFFGWVDFPYEYIVKSKCLVLTSHYESFGLVLAESIMLNTPIIAYNCSTGVQDIFHLQNDMEKYLIPHNDIILLSKKLQLCIQSPYIIKKETQVALQIKTMASKFLSLV